MNILNGYTNFSETNLDYIIDLVRKNAGLHLEISGNQLLLKTLDNTVISSVTIHYSEEAGHADTATNATNATYATSANSATNATNATNASHALTADSATTAGSATTATTATTAGTANEATHAITADTATNATNATHATNADYATTTGNVEHASNAFEAVETDGNNLLFTKGNGTTSSVTPLYAEKANKDSSNNVINTTYVANVVDNNGTLEFKNASGNTIVSITPSSQSATIDSYGNTIADFIKAISAASDDNYITVTHGTGVVDTLTINYANKAWKDTNGNIIKNYYIGSLEIVEDAETGHYNLVAYNGDTPKAELFRFEVNAYKAQEAEHADNASLADYATNAGHALTAGTADTSKDSYYIIKLQPVDVQTPDTLELVSIKDHAGNDVNLSDIDMTLMLNSYIELYHSNYNPSWSDYYKVIEINNPGGNPETAPIFFKAITDLNFSASTDDLNRDFNEVESGYISFGILNGVSIGGHIEGETIVKTPDYAMVLTSGSTDICTFAVNASDTFTTNVSYANLEDDLSNGKNIYDIKVGAYPDNDYTAHLTFNRGDVEFFVWDKSNNVNKRFVITAGGQDDEITITRSY